MDASRRTVVTLVLGLAFASMARADSFTANQIAQELKQDSVLSLRQNVASSWAANLLLAQASVSYASDYSLQLSINAVLKAIGIEQSIAGLNFCNLSNCIIANAQSTVAIDPNAGVGLTPTALYFGFVPVTATPEPALGWLLALGTIGFLLGWTYSARRRSVE